MICGGMGGDVMRWGRMCMMLMMMEGKTYGGLEMENEMVVTHDV